MSDKKLSIDEKKNFILENIDVLGKSEKSDLLWWCKNTGITLYSHADGTRMNLDRMNSNAVSWIYRYIELSLRLHKMLRVSI